MSILADFLNEQAAKYRSEAPERERNRNEWVGAVERLIQQMEGWLRGADSQQMLEVHWKPIELREEGLGVYTVPSLEIRMGDRQVEIIPRGRNAVGSITRDDNHETCPVRGRVDITDGGERHTLYRVTGDQGDEWFLADGRTHGAARFGKDVFEAVLVGLLE